MRSGWNGSNSSTRSPTPGELHRAAGDRGRGQGGAAARVAVELGEHDAR